MNPKFQPRQIAYIIETSIFVKEVYVISSSNGFCLIRYPNKKGGYRIRESRLFRTEQEALIHSHK